MDHLLPLLEMGYSLDEIECAYVCGCKSVEDALELFIGNARSFRSREQPGRLVLGAQHTKQSGSMFSSTRPFYVDLPRPNELGCSDSCEAATTNSLTTDSCDQNDSVVHSRHKRQRDAFIYNQTEARRVGNRLKRERLAQKEEKERLLAEIKEDKEARRSRQFTPSSPDTHGASADLVQTQPGHLDSSRSGQIRIKVILTSNSTTAPVILRLPDSAVFRDLLVAIQEHILHVTPLARPSFADSLPADVAGRLEEHLRTIQVTDSCIQLISYTWPRRTLPHCSSMTPADQDQTILSLSLADLGLPDGASLGVRHANCPFEPRTSTHDADDLVCHAVERAPTEDPISSSGESLLNPVDPGVESPYAVTMERRFPPNGHQLVPRAPGSVIPRNTLSARENVRRSALQLQHELLLLQASHPVASSSVSTLRPQRRWTGVTPLVILCHNRVLKIIVRYLESYAAARAGSGPTFYSDDGAAVLDCWFVGTLGTIWWPSPLGHDLVMALRERMQFNVHAATILRNCTTILDLSYYSLVTDDMVLCLTSRWHHLTELNLNGIREDQVSVHAVAEIRRLQNLRFLSLDGLRAVCDENICDILSLPNLRCLRMSSTRVTDTGWIEANQRSNQTCRSSLPLRELNASGLGSSLTNSGLKAIVSLFPLLIRLHLRTSHITEDMDPGIPPLEHLTYLDISSCQHLHCLPHVLIPPCSISLTQSGLTEIGLTHCSLLDLLTLLDQLKGQPIRCLRGLETLDTLNAQSLEAYAAAGFPLIELGLRPINFDWMVQSPRLLAQILLSVDPSHLLWLYLPQRPIERKTGDDCLAVTLQLLKRFENLKSLDMGDQVRQELEVNAVKEVLAHLPDLRSIVFVGLPEQFEESLASACPPQCSMQVQYFM